MLCFRYHRQELTKGVIDMSNAELNELICLIQAMSEENKGKVITYLRSLQDTECKNQHPVASLPAEPKVIE